MRFLTILLAMMLVVETGYADPAPPSMEEKLQRTRDIVNNVATGAETKSGTNQFNFKESAIDITQTLAILVGVVVIGAWLYKKYVLKDQPNLVKKLKVLERMPIAPRASLLVAEIDGRKILVGLTSDSIALLDLKDSSKTFAIELDKEISS